MATERQRRELCGELLKNVSRSFYLTLRVLPAGLRTPVGLAYLLARAADTIADTQIIPSRQRLELLLSFRAQVQGPLHAPEVRRIESLLSAHQSNPHERILLQSLLPALELLAELPEADRAEVRSVVTTLTTGMELDLTVFPLETSGQVVALQTPAELDRYIYLVAGCVGEFWTRITVAHTPALKAWDLSALSARGVRFGKALQLTNVLRDAPRDLRIGRCYLPAESLQALGLAPPDLLRPENSARVRPLLVEWLRVALDHYREAAAYTLAIPPSCRRLRLACLWPVLIGLPTLKLVAQKPVWLDPVRPAMIPTWKVYRLMAWSILTISSDKIIGPWIQKNIDQVEAAL